MFTCPRSKLSLRWRNHVRIVSQESLDKLATRLLGNGDTVTAGATPLRHSKATYHATNTPTFAATTTVSVAAPPRRLGYCVNSSSGRVRGDTAAQNRPSRDVFLFNSDESWR